MSTSQRLSSQISLHNSEIWPKYEYSCSWVCQLCTLMFIPWGSFFGKLDRLSFSKRSWIYGQCYYCQNMKHRIVTKYSTTRYFVIFQIVSGWNWFCDSSPQCCNQVLSALKQGPSVLDRTTDATMACQSSHNVIWQLQHFTVRKNVKYVPLFVKSCNCDRQLLIVTKICIK